MWAPLCGAFHSKPIELSSEQRDELREMSISRSLPAGDVLRARMMLMLADGRSYSEIQERLQTTAPTIFAMEEAVPQ
jgi:hypothetical protein